jgi:predicted nucleic acid-binding protein
VVFSRIQPEKDRVEGVVDVGLIVIAHFENPAKNHALEFLRNVLLWKKRCLIPVTAFLGAYHILTNYLGVEKVSACEALKKTLETRSPALYTDMNVDLAMESLTNAMGYRIESWDGYIVAIAKSNSAPIIYTIDKKMKRRVKDLHAVNPIPEDVFREYNEWLNKRWLNFIKTSPEF